MDLWQLETLGLETAAVFTLGASALAIWTAMRALSGHRGRPRHQWKRMLD
jgi:hypothetical protein